MLYERGRQEFFGRTTTLQTIAAVSKAKELSIYCGAGVTIDLTGLSWRDLIYDMITDRTVVGPDPEISIEDATILRESIDPLHLASVLAEYNSRHVDSEPRALQALHRAIQSRLYNNGEWQGGSLCLNIVRLAYRLARGGKQVTIVTSNYDVYLEEAFANVRTLMMTRKDVAGLRVFVLKHEDGVGPGSKIGRIEVREGSLPFAPAGKGAHIALVYLHGRVPREGKISGQLVVSEADYSKARPAVEKELTNSFTEREVLILGASLTDPPLLSSLAATADPQSRSTHKRVALLPVTSTGLLTDAGARFEYLKPHLRARMRQFDLTLLFPDFHYQIAQFCEEALEDLRLQAYRKKNQAVSHRYIERRDRWFHEWLSENPASEPQVSFRKLTRLLRRIETIWRDAVDDGTLHEEYLKVELWVRGDPDRYPRTLALWASSMGILFDRPAVRHEQLKVNSENAAVRAFCEGRPRHFLLSDLLASPDAQSDKRWRQFLTVPINVALETVGGSNEGVGAIPAGVVMLATMSESSSMPLPQAWAMQSIVSIMRSSAEELLTSAPVKGHALKKVPKLI